MRIKVNVLKPWSLAATNYPAGEQGVEIEVEKASKDPLPDTTLTEEQYASLCKQKVIEPAAAQAPAAVEDAAKATSAKK